MAASPPGEAGHEVHGSEHRRASLGPRGNQERVEVGSSGIDDHPRRNLERPVIEPIDGTRARDPAAFEHEAGRIDVVGERRSTCRSGHGPRERQAIGFGRDVVVPDRGADQAAVAAVPESARLAALADSTRPAGSVQVAATPRFRSRATSRSSRKPARIIAGPLTNDRCQRQDERQRPHQAAARSARASAARESTRARVRMSSVCR